MIKTSGLDPNFKYEIASEPGGENIKRCFNCTGCTVGCPVTEIDNSYNPRKLLRKALLGMRDEVLADDTLWLCASCYLCYERCPQDVKITEVMGAIRAIARREAKAGRLKLNNPKHLFDNLFIDSVKKNGKWYEAGVSGEFMLRTKGIKGVIGYVPMGLELFKKGKLGILPHKTRGTKEIMRIFEEVEK
ncbi:MAG: 4Fe-4S dicluster domain-containing protein [Candidatus Methanoperedens sp.]|nr:4Fe-4S dicluster domain-containing protein [Candidatus Methanoperedens sp.]